MTNIPTPHNSAKLGDIAKVVLMPGDPLRAKFIANTYLENPILFNEVRNMYGYTGTYKGKSISVMGSGMGIPSIAIYSYELYSFYDVDTIIRIGSCGGLSDDIKIRDIIISQAASTNSNYASQYGLTGTIAPICDYELLEKCVNTCKKFNVSYKVGNILSEDTFYNADKDFLKKWKNMGVLGCEMETAALYLNAQYLRKKALGIFTVSDHIFTGESLSSLDRQNSFTDMMQIALEIA